MIYLRAADLLDSVAMAKLRAASLVELHIISAPDAEPFIARAAFAFSALFRSGRIAAWIACDAESVVASACAVFFDRLPYPDGSRHAELCGVYVAPLYRKGGLASELVREVIGAARAGGARKTFLRPSKTAKSLYARLGFIESEVMVFAGASQRASAIADDLAARPGERLLAAWPRR